MTLQIYIFFLIYKHFLSKNSLNLVELFIFYNFRYIKYTKQAVNLA